jgi:hypothetical protein
MNKKGTGNARRDIPPSILEAGPIPSPKNMGLAANGIPQAIKQRRRLFAAMALAAY